MKKKKVRKQFELVLPAVLLLFTLNTQNNASKPIEESDFNPAAEMSLDMYRGGPSKIYHNIALPNAESILRPFRKRYPEMKFIHADNITSAIIAAGEQGRKAYNDILLGLELNETNANVLYTTTYRHALPVGVNLLTNILAHAVSSRRAGDADHTDGAALGVIREEPDTDAQVITTVNHPVPQAVMETVVVKVAKYDALCLMWVWIFATFFPLTMVGITSIAFCATKNSTRHIRIMSGVPMCLYYAVMALFHFAMFIVIVVPITLIALLAIDQDSTFNNTRFVFALLLLTVLYGMAFLPMCYIVSFYVTETGGNSVMFLVSLMFGVFFPLLLVSYNSSFAHVGRFVPSFNYALGFYKLTIVAQYNAACALNKKLCPTDIAAVKFGLDYFVASECCNSTMSYGYIKYYFSDYYDTMKGPELELLVIFLETILLWIWVILIQRGSLSRLWGNICNRNYREPPQVFEDKYVEAEMEYVKKQAKHGAAATLKEDTALVHNVHKTYRNCLGMGHAAVEGVNFSVKQGECFGLLGVNGAGKSTLFKMMTGLETLTRGEIYADGYKLSENRTKYLRTMTYCPQFGGIDGFLSGLDNIKMMAVIRGVPPAHVDEEVSAAIRRVHLERECRRITDTFSGGCQRRCVTAAALIGAAATSQGRFIAVLDEPTAGVDPSGRRNVWASLRHSMRRRLSIVMSSHSMEETELLCHRIAIMARGQIGALGSATQLRETYATGYTVTIKLRTAPHKRGSLVRTRPASTADMIKPSASGRDRSHSIEDMKVRVKAAMASSFTCDLKDEHQHLLRYSVMDRIGYGELFDRMDAVRKAHSDIIEDYTITGTTLEQVFLSFVEEEEEDQSN